MTLYIIWSTLLEGLFYCKYCCATKVPFEGTILEIHASLFTEKFIFSQNAGFELSFQKMIHNNLVCSSNNYGVWDQNTIQMQENSVQFNIFRGKPWSK